MSKKAAATKGADPGSDDDDEDVNAKNNLLKVKVVKADDIIAADRGGTSDAYAIVDFQGLKRQTQVVKKSLTPNWDESFEFECGRPNGRLLISIMVFHPSRQPLGLLVWVWGWGLGVEILHRSNRRTTIGSARTTSSGSWRSTSARSPSRRSPRAGSTSCRAPDGATSLQAAFSSPSSSFQRTDQRTTRLASTPSPGWTASCTRQRGTPASTTSSRSPAVPPHSHWLGASPLRHSAPLTKPISATKPKPCTKLECRPQPP